jgi:hypothetical protein
MGDVPIARGAPDDMEDTVGRLDWELNPVVHARRIVTL